MNKHTHTQTYIYMRVYKFNVYTAQIIGQNYNKENANKIWI